MTTRRLRAMGGCDARRQGVQVAALPARPRTEQGATVRGQTARASSAPRLLQPRLDEREIRRGRDLEKTGIARDDPDASACRLDKRRTVRRSDRIIATVRAADRRGGEGLRCLNGHE